MVQQLVTHTTSSSGSGKSFPGKTGYSNSNAMDTSVGAVTMNAVGEWHAKMVELEESDQDDDSDDGSFDSLIDE